MNLNDVLSHHVQSRLRSFKFLLLERHWVYDPYDSQDLLVDMIWDWGLVQYTKRNTSDLFDRSQVFLQKDWVALLGDITKVKVTLSLGLILILKFLVSSSSSRVKLKIE